MTHYHPQQAQMLMNCFLKVTSDLAERNKNLRTQNTDEMWCLSLASDMGKFSSRKKMEAKLKITQILFELMEEGLEDT